MWGRERQTWALWSLVTGIPEPRRSGGLLFMLQALIDESQSFGQLPLFVLGGYISTAERWARLTEAWHDALSASPSIEYFKFKEAFPPSGKPSGQFRNLTVRERDRKVKILRSIIEEFALVEIGIGFQLAPYERAFRGIDRMADNPYYFATSQLEVWVARNIEKVGLERGPLQFIYDDRKVEERHVLDAWWWAKDMGKPEPPDLFETVFTTAPSFRSSSGRPDSVIALQAADMFVGWTRACNEIELQGGLPLPLPGTKRRLPGIFITFTDEMLQDAADRIKKRNAVTSPKT